MTSRCRKVSTQRWELALTDQMGQFLVVIEKNSIPADCIQSHTLRLSHRYGRFHLRFAKYPQKEFLSEQRFSFTTVESSIFALPPSAVRTLLFCRRYLVCSATWG